jgi:putative hydrolase of the HAD superfamily
MSSPFPSDLRPPSWLDALIFDLGGTLIDYLGGAPSWPEMETPGVRGLHAHLTQVGLRDDAEQFHAQFIEVMDARWRAATAGLGPPPTIRSLVAEVCATADLELTEDLHAAAVVAYCSPIAARALVAPGAYECARWLTGAGVRLGLISNTLWPVDAHCADLERYGLLPLLDELIFSSECGLWKPDPRIFELALDRLSVRPQRAVFVGDRLAEDVQGAKRAGLHALWIDDGSQRLSDLSPDDVRPDSVIRTLWELPAALARVR